MTVLEAAQTGDEIATLEAMRDRLAAAMDEATTGAIGQTAAQLAAVLRRLADLRPAGRVTIDDALAERRAARAGRADDQAPAKRKAKSAG
jgi:hypothetical protein